MCSFIHQPSTRMKKYVGGWSAASIYNESGSEGTRKASAMLNADFGASDFLKK